MRISLALATAAAALGFATAAPASTFYVTTGQAGGVFSLDTDEQRIWTIVPQTGETAFGGGMFMMMRGAGITAGITLALYNDANSILDSVSIPSTAVGLSYTQINLLLAAPYVVNLADTYTVRLTVDTGTPLGGPDRYFIQGDTDTLDRDTRPPEEIILATTTTSTPEPASALVLAAGILGLGIARRRHQRPG